VQAKYPAGAKDLQVSMHQAAVLLLFNGRDELSYEEIAEALQLPDGELRRTLQSLALGKARAACCCLLSLLAVWRSCSEACSWIANARKCLCC
jgi:Cullin family